MDKPQCFCGTVVTKGQLALIVEIVNRYGGLSRTELANTLCELLRWVRPNGKLKTVECRQFLEELDEQSLIQLPARGRTGRKKGKSAPIKLTALSAPRTPLEGTVREFQPITLRRVLSADDRQLWRELIERYHYLGYRIPFGAHLCYFIEVSRPATTIVGCIQLSSPAWRMAARDRWIGWEDEVRARQLQRVVNNSRFLLFPFVRIANLASHVLSLLSRCVVRDWESSYHIRPVLLETLVDTQRFTGSCYRAANWLELGQTSGRGRQDRGHERHGSVPKTLFVYPLHRHVVACLKNEHVAS
jgi:hypothetical protein